jgi:GntR family transcriptional regulator/MocR family aminotransferase
MTFEAVGATICAMPVDGEGMILRKRSMRGVKLIYVTPGHQFPLGTTMSLPRRLASRHARRGSRPAQRV